VIEAQSALAPGETSGHPAQQAIAGPARSSPDPQAFQQHCGARSTPGRFECPSRACRATPAKPLGPNSPSQAAHEVSAPAFSTGAPRIACNRRGACRQQRHGFEVKGRRSDRTGRTHELDRVDPGAESAETDRMNTIGCTNGAAGSFKRGEGSYAGAPLSGGADSRRRPMSWARAASIAGNRSARPDKNTSAIDVIRRHRFDRSQRIRGSGAMGGEPIEPKSALLSQRLTTFQAQPPGSRVCSSARKVEGHEWPACAGAESFQPLETALQVRPRTNGRGSGLGGNLICRRRWGSGHPSRQEPPRLSFSEVP